MALALVNTNRSLKRSRHSSSSDLQSSHKKARIGGSAVDHPRPCDQMNKLEPTRAQIACHDSAGDLKSSAPETTTSENAAAINVCAVTGTTSKDVETCHIIPQGAPAVDIEQLEDIWGLERHSLDVDHPSNLIFLTPELHRAFKSGEWALVPSSPDLVRKLRGFEVGRDGASNIFDAYGKVDEPMFTYDIVPLSGCKVVFGPDPSHFPPYTTLPKVTLPVYPHLVLVNLTAKYIRLSSKVETLVGRWMSDNNPVAGCMVDYCVNIHKRWLPTLRFQHEYAHLPPVDKALNRLLGPRDSYSQVLKRMGVFEDEDEEDEEEVKDWTKDFYATRTKRQLRKMVEEWLVGVRKGMDRVDPKHSPPEPSEMLPSSPLAPSSGSSSSDRSAPQS